MSATINPPTGDYTWSSIEIEPGKIIALTQSLMDDGVSYGYDYKAHPIGVQAPGFVGYSDAKHTFGKSVDCSGFVRWAIYHATGGVAGNGLLIPDGSVNQHEWVEQNGFKESDPSDAGDADGRVRISFLAPSHSPDGIGHVMLLPGDGSTCESHGGKGPDRRVWGSMNFMNSCVTYVLDPTGN